MNMDNAAPCRHAGVPNPEVQHKVAEAIHSLGRHPEVLARYGITPDEYAAALPSAIESIRGRKSANRTQSRNFLAQLLQHLVKLGLVESLETPAYGSDTVYRLSVAGLGPVAIIQKGCPDGKHSSQTWSAPEWAVETYLWWLCSSPSMHPGAHVAKGVARLRNKWLSDDVDSLHGVIFHNEICGTADRLCPKMDKSIYIDGQWVPPPCIYTMPEPRSNSETSWNWNSEREAEFPKILLRAFGIAQDSTYLYTGAVGFRQRTQDAYNTNITARFGVGRTTRFRSSS